MTDDLASAFEEQVERQPRRMAVCGRKRSLSYRHLDRTANRIAHRLLEATSSGRAPVALLVEPDASGIAALLGIHKAGKIVLPLNTRAPLAALRAVAASAGAEAVLAENAHLETASQIGDCPVVAVESPSGDVSAEAPPRKPDPLAPAAVLFTSGSTGEPNGVVQVHRGVVARVRSHCRALGVTPEDRMTLLAPLHVGAASTSLYAPLIAGACVLPFDVASRSLRELRTWIDQEQVTIYHSTPTLFRSFCQTLPRDLRLSSVRVVKLGGEPVRANDVELARTHFREDCVLVNGLGISEGNGNVSRFVVGPDDPVEGDRIPIGRPVEGIAIHLWDEECRDVAPGDVGEIVLESEQLGPCYWHRPDLDAARFEPAEAGWFFRTGDLGRLREDGELLHLGRRDDQVKVRGHSVRLQDVEAVLLGESGIRQAGVVSVVPEHGRAELRAYVVPEATDDFDLGALRERLRGVLAPHALPSRYFVLEALPRSPTGKIDRRRLAELEEKPLPERDADSLVDTAARIAAIWSNLLGTPCGPAEPDFFDAGGDSLGALVMLSEVEASFGVDVALAGFNEAPGVAALARLVEDALRTGEVSATPGSLLLRDGSHPPLFLAPGAGSDASTLAVLASKLPGDRAFVGLQWRGIDGRQLPHATIDEMADAFLGEMRAIQRSGPHHIGGASFGGLVAFEVARRLQQEGDPPASLLILDTRLPDYLRPRGRGPLRHLRRWAFEQNAIGWNRPPSWNSVRQGLHQRRRIRESVREASASRAQGWLVSHKARYLDLLDRMIRATAAYRTDYVYPGSVTLFRTRERAPADAYDIDPSLGWRRRIAGELTIVDIDGEHGDFLKLPQAASLARHIAVSLGSGSDAA